MDKKIFLGVDCMNMKINFMDDGHEAEFSRLMIRARSSVKDPDRTALFYIISGSTELTRKVDALYDFKQSLIHSDTFAERADFSGGMRGLIYLAFNLYNGYEPCNPYHLFGNLDEYHRELAHRAIKIRFPY